MIMLVVIVTEDVILQNIGHSAYYHVMHMQDSY